MCPEKACKELEIWTEVLIEEIVEILTYFPQHFGILLCKMKGVVLETSNLLLFTIIIYF